MKKFGLVLIILAFGLLTACSTSKNTSRMQRAEDLIAYLDSFSGVQDEQNSKKMNQDPLIKTYQRWISEDYATQSKLLEKYMDLKECGDSLQDLPEARKEILRYYGDIQMWQDRIRGMKK